MSPRIGRGTGFAKWPALVTVKREGQPARIEPRVIPGRKYMNKRGQWSVTNAAP